ncbi:MAG: glycosyltransferase family 39 protein [Verrucomicrobiota bacterium]
MTLPGRSSARLVWLGVAALLLLHAVLALHAVSKKSVTADEILHVTAGDLYWRYGDFRLQPENGNLPQRAAGLPSWLMGAKPPPLENNLYWKTADASVIGYQFFYEAGNDHWPLLMAGRSAVLVFGLGTGLLIFFWSRTLFGTPAGFLSLALYALCPNFLAHNALTTSDSASVFFLLATCGAFWRHVQHPTLANGALSALTLGLACVAKFSFLLLAPTLPLLAVLRLLLEPRGGRLALGGRLAVSALGHVAVAGTVIWAFFGFRFSGFAPGVPPADHYMVPWDAMLPYIGVHASFIEFCRAWKLLPEAFLYGYGMVMQYSNARGAFLAGEYSIFGWREFFPLAFAWKTPLVILAASALGAFLLARRWLRHRAGMAGDLARAAPLLVFAVICWAVWIPSHLNIGHRHILPTYPVLFILLGGLAAPGLLSPRLRFLPVLLVIGQGLASARIHPHYLAYFNALAGGPANGYRLLVDSSLDWGQDLPGLAGWLRTRPAPGAAEEAVYLSYFGSGEPDYYGIRATRLPFLNGFKLPIRWYRPGPGLYCVGATMLQQVYSNVSKPWTHELESEYQRLRESADLFRRFYTDPASRPELVSIAPVAQWDRAWLRYDQLRFTRLCYYLRARPPEATVGYSILIYRLTEEDTRLAFDSSFTEWLQAIERRKAAR